MMVPRRLPEYREGERVGLNRFAVRCFGSFNIWVQVSTEEPRGRRARLECPHAAQHFAPVVSCHPSGSDLASPLVYKQIRRVRRVNASIAQVNSTLCVVGKRGEEFFRNRDDLMCLAARFCYPAGNHDILAITIASAERI